jgi:hypothetical protein
MYSVRPKRQTKSAPLKAIPNMQRRSLSGTEKDLVHRECM